MMTAGGEMGDADAMDVSSEDVDDAGLEREFDRGPEIEVPFDPTKIDIIVKPMTLSSLQDRLENGELDLTPDFQRQANVWNPARKARLIESVLLRIPLPSFYFSEDQDGVYSVVDGLQRLCAIFHFRDAPLLERVTGAKLKPLRLEGLQYLKEMEDRSYVSLDRKFQRRISELEITANVIRASTPPAVKFNVFARLNQGGMPLNAQEIRNAIFPGEWRARLKEFAEQPRFLRITENKVRTERQQDMEMVLRFVALWQLQAPYERQVGHTLDEFLNGVVQDVLSRWSEKHWSSALWAFDRNLEAASKIFGHHVFRKSFGNQYRKPINRGLFEAQLLAVSELDSPELETLIHKRELVSLAFGKTLAEDADFARSLLYATGSAEASNTRIKTMRRIFAGVLNA